MFNSSGFMRLQALLQPPRRHPPYLPLHSYARLGDPTPEALPYYYHCY